MMVEAFMQLHPIRDILMFMGCMAILSLVAQHRYFKRLFSEHAWLVVIFGILFAAMVGLSDKPDTVCKHTHSYGDYL